MNTSTARLSSPALKWASAFIRIQTALPLLFFLAIARHAVAQSNDICAGAATLLSGVTNYQNISGATTNGDPATCITLRQAVWYAFTAPANGRLDISTAGTDFSTALAAYTGACGALTQFQCVAGSRLAFGVTNSAKYYILVGKYSSGSASNLQIAATFLPAPTNDICSDAVPLNWGVTNIVGTTNATEFGESPACGYLFARGVWFSFSAISNEMVHVSTCGSSFTPTVTIYTNGCASLGQVQCAPYRSSCSTVASFTGTAGVTYHILVGGYAGASGTLKIVALRSPPNDSCAAAVTLLPDETKMANTVTATTNGDPRVTCQMGKGVWYKVTPAIDQRINISVAGSDFFTVLAVFTNACGSTIPQQCVVNSALSFSGAAGTTYYILVGDYYGAGGNLRIAADLRAPPGNDNCSSPIDLTSVATNVTDISHATELNERPSCQGSFSRGVWYTFTPTNDGRLNIATSGSDFSSTLAAYTGTCQALTQQRCTNSANLNFSVSNGVTYFILAGKYSGLGSNLRITATLLSPPPTNDTCYGATPLEWGVTNVVSTTNATELGESSLCGGLGHGVWYSITPTINEMVHISTCGSSFPTALVIYTNDCGSLRQMQCVPQRTSCPALDVSFAGVAGTTYYILAGGRNDAFGTLKIVALQSPPNDTCAGAITLIPGRTNVVSTVAASSTGDAIANCPASELYDGDRYTYELRSAVWYTITPEANRRVRITKVSNFPTVLAAFLGSCGNLARVQCVGDYKVTDFDFGIFLDIDAELNFSAAAGTAYYVGAFGAYPDLQLTATVLTPPTNDLLSGAVRLVLGETNMLNIASATEIDDPNVGIDHGVWYSVAVDRDTGLAISTCGTDFNTGIRVYSNASGALADVAFTSTPLCNRSSVTFAARSGTTYYIFVGGQNTWSAGNLQIVAFESPLNDTCAGAIPMTPGIVYRDNTLTATDAADPIPRCGPIGRGVWYQYTSPISGRLSISSCGGALAVYTGTCGAPLTEIDCSRFGFTCSMPRLKFDAVAGTTYYFLAQGGDDGNLQILIPVVDFISMQPFATNSAGGPPTAGRPFSAGWTVTNQGINPVISSTLNAWTDRLSLSNATTNVVMRFGAHAVGAAAGYPNLTNFTLPRIPAGTYSLIAETDINNDIVETNENNNIRVVLVTITNLPPSVSLLAPTNNLIVTSCVPVAFNFAATTQLGSYAITNVQFYAGSTLLAQTNRAPYQAKKIYLPHGEHSITAQTVDDFGLRGTSLPNTISVRWPGELHRLRADLNTNTECVVCMRGIEGSTYLIETTTDVRPPVTWSPERTHGLSGSILIFTNQPLDPQRYFRAKLLP